MTSRHKSSLLKLTNPVTTLQSAAGARIQPAPKLRTRSLRQRGFLASWGKSTVGANKRQRLTDRIYGGVFPLVLAGREDAVLHVASSASQPLHGAGCHNDAGMLHSAGSLVQPCKNYPLSAPVLTRTKITRHHCIQVLRNLYPPPELQVNTAKCHFSPSLSPSARLLFCREFHAEKPFCISAQSLQAPKQLRLMVAQLAWTLFIRRSMGIHQAELAQIRGRAFSFFMCDAALAARRPP